MTSCTSVKSFLLISVAALALSGCGGSGGSGGSAAGTSGTDGGSTDNSGTNTGSTDNSGTNTGSTDNSGTNTGSTDNSGTNTGSTDNSGTNTGSTDNSGTNTGSTDNSGTNTGSTDNSGTNTGSTDNSGTNTGTNTPTTIIINGKVLVCNTAGTTCTINSGSGTGGSGTGGTSGTGTSGTDTANSGTDDGSNGATTPDTGNTTTPAPTPVVVPNYADFSVTSSKTSEMAGVVIRANLTTQQIELLHGTGSYTHDTKETVVSDGIVTLTDPDGAKDNILTRGLLTMHVLPDMTGNADYGLAYNFDYNRHGDRYTSLGALGIATQPDHMPTTGIVSYSGSARARVRQGDTVVNLDGGSSAVTANFASGKVDVTLSGFTSVTDGDGNMTAAPISAVRMQDMAVSGNSYSGGTVTTVNGLSTVEITGPNTTSTTRGVFLGYNRGQKMPDETVGGVVISGDTASVSGLYLAD